MDSIVTCTKTDDRHAVWDEDSGGPKERRIKRGEILQRNGAILIQYLCSDLDPVPDVTAVRLDQLRHVLSPKRMIVKQRKSRRQTVAIAIRTNQRIYRLCYQLLKISSTIYW